MVDNGTTASDRPDIVDEIEASLVRRPLGLGAGGVGVGALLLQVLPPPPLPMPPLLDSGVSVAKTPGVLFPVIGSAGVD